MATTKATLIQGSDKQVKSVRIGNAEFPVMHAGPAVGDGCMNLVIQIADVDIAYEKAIEEPQG